MPQAEPIIFIHGLFAVLAQSQESDEFSMAQFFAPNPVSIPDLPGYGVNRPYPLAGISVDGAVDFIYTHMHALGYERAHIVGHSIGGVVAVAVASRYPEAVTSLISAEGNFTLKDAFWTQRLAQMDESEADALFESYRADPRVVLAGAGVDATSEQIELLAQSLSAQPTSTLQAMARSVVQITGDESYLQKIAAILDRSIPLHLVAGERSREGWDVPEWVLQRAASVTIQPGVGHMMMLEDQQGFLSIIRQLVPV
jgi:pimeloyl-ACP methyl ester carboxylesterase